MFYIIKPVIDNAIKVIIKPVFRKAITKGLKTAAIVVITEIID
jgi:hypothetical protein